MWQERRSYIFRAFEPFERTPKINQAEVIHASWVKRDRMNMSILDAAYSTDCLDNIQLEASYKAFMDGTRKGGKGSSHLERQSYKRKDQ